MQQGSDLQSEAYSSLVPGAFPRPLAYRGSPVLPGLPGSAHEQGSSGLGLAVNTHAAGRGATYLIGTMPCRRCVIRECRRAAVVNGRVLHGLRGSARLQRRHCSPDIPASLPHFLPSRRSEKGINWLLRCHTWERLLRGHNRQTPYSVNTSCRNHGDVRVLSQRSVHYTTLSSGVPGVAARVGAAVPDPGQVGRSRAGQNLQCNEALPVMARGFAACMPMPR